MRPRRPARRSPAMDALRLDPPAGATEEALDAYSAVVTTVVDRLTPSVASLRVWTRTGRGRAEGSGSAVAISEDGFMITSAHVVAGTERGSATFVDGSELAIDVVGSDPLSDLAVVRAAGQPLVGAEMGDAANLR